MKMRFIGVLGGAVAVATLMAGCAPAPEGGAVDLEAPQIVSVDVSPLDVNPGQSITITATVSDNVAVTDVAFLVGRNGTPSGFCSGGAHLVGGTASLGTWELTCDVPAVLNAGQYEVGTVALDARLNATATSPDSPAAVRATFNVLGETNDHDAPVIESVTTTPSVVSPGTPITISAHITDATGVSNVGFLVRRERTDTMDWCGEGARLASGTPTDGTWELTCTVGASAAPGEYRVNTAAADVLNNFTGIGDDGADTQSGPFTVVVR